MAGRILAALRAQLGNDGTFGLIELLETGRKEASQQVLAMAADRFERRMAEELGKIREEIATTRVEMLRWSFVFWIGLGRRSRRSPRVHAPVGQRQILRMQHGLPASTHLQYR